MKPTKIQIDQLRRMWLLNYIYETQNDWHCQGCGKVVNTGYLSVHELRRGAYRTRSVLAGLMAALCHDCHRSVTDQPGWKTRNDELLMELYGISPEEAKRKCDQIKL